MRGTLKQRSKGSWTIIIDAGRDPATGKRRQQWHTVKGTKREAEKRLTELVHQVDNGVYVKSGNLTVGAYLEQWLGVGDKMDGLDVLQQTAQQYRTLVVDNTSKSTQLDEICFWYQADSVPRKFRLGKH